MHSVQSSYISIIVGFYSMRVVEPDSLSTEFDDPSLRLCVAMAPGPYEIIAGYIYIISCWCGYFDQPESAVVRAGCVKLGLSA